MTQRILRFLPFFALALTLLSSPAWSAAFPRFTASISDGGGTPIAGMVNGAFYGPTAEAVGGNFYASGDNKQYIGIFGGNR